MKLVEDNEKRSQEEQKNTEDEQMNCLFLVHESCESAGMDLQEESVCAETADNEHLFPQINSLCFCNKHFSDEKDCDACVYAYSSEKCHTYNLCSKTFSVTKHIHTNTNEKAFICTICSKSFSHKTHLVSHNRRPTHTNEKPFTCRICSKSFSEKIKPCNTYSYSHKRKTIHMYHV